MTKYNQHPVWGLLQVIILCGTLLGLQLVTAQSWDAGEGTALGGVTAMAVLLEWVRRKT
jgi:hypothetical protein